MAKRSNKAIRDSAAGIRRITLERIENGEQSPRYETLIAIARAVKRPLADLISDEPAD
ncbi:MAG: helix-turn-helix transcriptional regulator [Dehalococcoidales bacterium]|nr:helix-turn-helix transcriptional regulator [Dehalococcoidales bacterium]